MAYVYRSTTSTMRKQAVRDERDFTKKYTRSNPRDTEDNMGETEPVSEAKYGNKYTEGAVPSEFYEDLSDDHLCEESDISMFDDF